VARDPSKAKFATWAPPLSRPAGKAYLRQEDDLGFARNRARSPRDFLNLRPQEVFQRSNRSTILEARGVYDKAEESQSWKVSEMRLEKLPHTDENKLTKICQAFGHQVVRVDAVHDPIKDCVTDGSARVLLRHSAGAAAKDLGAFLEESLGCKVSTRSGISNGR
jgi:hypothetical protein